MFRESAIYDIMKIYQVKQATQANQVIKSQTQIIRKIKSHWRNVIWFDTPYAKNVTTRIGRSFLNLIDTQFPKNHTFNKILNRNKIKVSYSCMQNIKTIINDHPCRQLHVQKTTAPNLLLMKITQTTQNCRKNTGKSNEQLYSKSNLEHR